MTNKKMTEREFTQVAFNELLKVHEELDRTRCYCDVHMLGMRRVQYRGYVLFAQKHDADVLVENLKYSKLNTDACIEHCPENKLYRWRVWASNQTRPYAAVEKPKKAQKKSTPKNEAPNLTKWERLHKIVNEWRSVGYSIKTSRVNGKPSYLVDDALLCDDILADARDAGLNVERIDASKHPNGYIVIKSKDPAELGDFLNATRSWRKNEFDFYNIDVDDTDDVVNFQTAQDAKDFDAYCFKRAIPVFHFLYPSQPKYKERGFTAHVKFMGFTSVAVSSLAKKEDKTVEQAQARSDMVTCFGKWCLLQGFKLDHRGQIQPGAINFVRAQNALDFIKYAAERKVNLCFLPDPTGDVAGTDYTCRVELDLHEPVKKNTERFVWMVPASWKSVTAQAERLEEAGIEYTVALEVK